MMRSSPALRTSSVTDRSDRIRNDRQAHLFDLYDCARAAENQVFVVSSNQTGVMGSLRFLGQAKVVGPGGVFGYVVILVGAKGGPRAVAPTSAAGSPARSSSTARSTCGQIVPATSSSSAASGSAPC